MCIDFRAVANFYVHPWVRENTGIQMFKIMALQRLAGIMNTFAECILLRFNQTIVGDILKLLLGSLVHPCESRLARMTDQ